MRKKIRKLINVSFLAALTTVFTVASTGAYALSNETNVANTGDDVEIETEAEMETNISVSNSNTAVVNQVVVATSNTGGNSSSGNIGNSSIGTGDATTQTTTSVEANNNQTAIALSGSGSAANTTNIVNTGNNADIETELDVETNIGVANNNQAFVNQATFASSNTGYNTADGNIGDSNINTGDAEVMTSQSANLNNNGTFIYLGDLENDDSGFWNSLMLTNTGDNVDIEAEAELETNIGIWNNNFLLANQMLFADANTGWNSASDNIGPSSVMTGSATLDSEMSVEGNSNMTGVGGGVLSPDASNTSDVLNTGDDLELEAELEIETNIGVANNNAHIGNQAAFVSTDTGWNDTNDSIGESEVVSGVAESSVQMTTETNTNSTLLGMLAEFFSSMMSAWWS